MDKDYIINIILRARDEIAGTVAKATAEISAMDKAAGNSSGLDSMNDKAERLAQTMRTKVFKAYEDLTGKQRETGSETDRLGAKFEKLTKQADETNKKLGSMGGFQKLDQDLTKSKKSLDENTHALANAENALRDAERAAASERSEIERSTLARRRHEKSIADASRAVDNESSKLRASERQFESSAQRMGDYAKESENLGKITDSLNKTTSEHSRSVSSLTREYENNAKALAKMKAARAELSHRSDASNFDFASFDKQIAEQDAKVHSLAAKLNSLQDIGIEVHLDTKEFDAEAAAVEITKKRLDGRVEVNIESDLAKFTAEMEVANAMKNKLGRAPAEGGGNGLKGWASELKDAFDSNGHSIASFDNSIRGLVVLGAVASGQQLLTIMTSLGGELISVGSSAIFAGSALGGALTAGAAEALPVVGLLVSSLARVTAVISAVKQTETMRQQESYKSETGEGAEISANEGMLGATEAVTAARENLMLAEVGLTKSRFEARRGLEDLIMTERQAELAAKGATLSQIESNIALRQAMGSGSITEFANAQINVQESRINAQGARRDAQRARQDLRFQERGSPLRPDTSVESAERAVSQGRTGLKQAERSAGAAGRAAEEAANKEISSTGKLNFMLGELDEKEKQLYTDARRLYQVYKEVTRPITDVLTEVFDKGAKKGIALLKNPELDSAFKELADKMGSNFERVLNIFTSPKWIKFFSTMTKDAGENIGPLTNTFITLAETFRAIAEAAAPVLHDILGWIQEGAEEFQDWVGSGDHLESFFKEGEAMLEAWLKLTHAVIDLFLALIGDSAKQGTEQVEDLTGAIHEATQWLEDHKATVEEFFHDVGEVMAALGVALVELGAAILEVFNVENTKAFIDLISRVFIPALQAALEVFGSLVKLADDLAKNPVGGALMKGVAAALIFGAVMKPIFQGFASMWSFASKTFALLGRMAGIPKVVQQEQGVFGSLRQRATGTTWDKNGNVISGPATKAESAVGGTLSKFGGRALTGLGIATTGLAIGTAIGGKAGKAIDFASVGAGLGMFAGPEGAAIGAGIGLVADAVLELFGSEKKLTPKQKEMNELTEAYPDLAKEAKSAAEQLKENEEGISTARDEAKTSAHEINRLEEKLTELREGSAGHNQIIAVEEKLAEARKENNKQLREKNKLEDASPAVRANTSAVTQRALSNVDLQKRTEEGRLRRIERQESKEGATPELTEKFLARNKNVEKLRAEAQEYTKVLHSIGGKSAAAAEEINHSWLQAKYGLTGSGLIRSIERLKEELTNLIPTSPPAEKIKLEEELGKFERIYGKFRENVGNAFERWQRHIQNKLKIELTPAMKKALEGGQIGNTSAERRWGEGKALGGPIGSGFGGGDVVPIMAEPGEHMLTKEDVRNAGGHSAIFALRSLLGGGSQASGSRMAEGGIVGTSGSSSSISLEGVLEMIDNFGGAATAAWDGIWDDIQHRTDQGTGSVEHEFIDMEKSLVSSSKRTQNQVVKSFNSLFGDVQGDINQLTHVVYNGLSYVAEITEKALQGFGVKKISLSIPKPKGAGGKGSAEAKAEGGWIGSQGERGGDFINTWLGKGEAVLNYAHQRVVEPAMRAYHGFGLNEMFSRTNAEHGFGGAGAGFAKGRPGMSSAELFDGHPSNVASSLVKLIEIMKKRWPMLEVTSTTDHGYLTSSGNVSDHTTGHAVDLARPMDSSGISYMNKAAAWVKGSGLYKQIKQGIHNPNLAIEEGAIETPPGIYAGQTWSEHLNHIHLAVHDALSGAFGGGLGGGAAAKALKGLKVNGSEGVLKAIAQSAVAKAVKAATHKINGSMAVEGDASTGYVSGGVSGSAEHNAQAIMKALMGHGLSKKVAAGITGNALQESGWMPGSIGSGGGGLWGFTASPNSLADLQSYAAAKGKNWEDIGLQVEFLLEHVDSSILSAMGAEPNAAAAAAYFMENWERPLVSSENQANRELGAREAFSGEYAKGGSVSGSGGAGKGIPILAHLGEWIVNEGQQHKLANMLGVSVDKLKGMMGFSGGPIGYAGGGEPNEKSKGKKPAKVKIGLGEAESVFADPMVDLENFKAALNFYAEEVGKELTTAKEALQEATKSKKPGEAIGDFITKNLGELEARLVQFKEAWETASKEMMLHLAKAGIHIGKNGKVLGAGANPAQLLELEIKDTYKEVEFLFEQKGPILKGLHLAQKAFKAARKAGSKGAEEKAQNAILAYKRMLHENELSIAESQRTILEKQMQREQEAITKITEAGERRVSKDSSGKAVVTDIHKEEAQLQAKLAGAKKHRNRELVKTIEAELQSLESSVVEQINAASEEAMVHASGTSQELGVIGQQEQQLNGALDKAKARRNVGLVKQIEAEKRQLEAQVVETIDKGAEARVNHLTNRANIASAYGFSEFAAGIQSNAIGVLQEQSAQLNAALGQARAHGNAQLAAQIEQEMEGIEVSIAEATAAMFQSSITAVEKHFARQAAFRGMVEATQNAQATIIGNSTYSAQLRQGQLYGERNEEVAQKSETERLLAEAIGKGFGPDVTEPLEEKIWALTGAIAENGATIFQNTIAIRQSYLDQIQGRSGFQTGVFGTLEQIVNGLGALSGTINQTKLIELIMAIGQKTKAAGWELRGQLQGFNEERLGNNGAIMGLIGLEGEALVAAIQNLNLTQIEAELGNEELIGQFRSLIEAVLQNEVATIENTKQLQEAMQEQKIQSFTSSAWSFFRSALFNGMGGLMPEYAAGTPFYSADSGGEMQSDGAVNAHRGEIILPRNYSSILKSLADAGSLASGLGKGSMPGYGLGDGLGTGMGLSASGGSMAAEIANLREELARRAQEINVNVTEAEPTDPTYLANRLAFAVKNPST